MRHQRMYAPADCFKKWGEVGLIMNGGVAVR
jgi:hypothetical protein